MHTHCEVGPPEQRKPFALDLGVGVEDAEVVDRLRHGCRATDTDRGAPYPGIVRFEHCREASNVVFLSVTTASPETVVTKSQNDGRVAAAVRSDLLDECLEVIRRWVRMRIRTAQEAAVEPFELQRDPVFEVEKPTAESRNRL